MLVDCPFCHQKSEVPAEPAEGQHVRCAYCNQKFSYHRPPETEEKPLPSLKAGQTIGAYKILRCVGQGGMGAVYEVEHITLGAHFAMKVFTAQTDNGHDDILKQKFLDEAKQLSAIKHANIAHVFDLSVDNATGAPYFVMDLVTYAGGEPCTLDDLDHSKIEEDLIFLWFSEMCKVLDYVHSLGVIHRDIKLENILINQDQHVVLTDFGVAKVFEGLAMNAVKGGCKTSGTNDENLIFGTPHYMAPEIERGEDVTAAADVYSLGVAFFRLLTGVWYDKHPEAIKTLAHRKYNWAPVLSAMLAPVEKRPTRLSKFPVKLSSRVTTKFRQAGTWKLVLADKKKKSNLFKEIEKARHRQEMRERRKQKLKKLLVVACIAEAAMFAGLAYYMYTPHKKTRATTQAPEEDNSFKVELRIARSHHGLCEKWRDIERRFHIQFKTETDNLEKEMTALDNLIEKTDYSDKLRTDAVERKLREMEKVLDARKKDWEAWNSLYYVSGECERLIDETKRLLATANEPQLSTALQAAEKHRHVGNLHKMKDEYAQAVESYEKCIRVLTEALAKARHYKTH